MCVGRLSKDKKKKTHRNCSTCLYFKIVWNAKHDGSCTAEGAKGLETHQTLELLYQIHFRSYETVDLKLH